MSFFFTKQAAKPAKQTPSKPTQAGKASKDTLNRLGCRACPLDRADNCTPKMLPDLIKQTDIYFLGDSPNDTDDKKGAPFTSKMGKILKGLVGGAVSCSYDNVVRDYINPFGDRPAPTWVAMECCRSLVTKSIEQAKPKLVVGLGIQPLQSSTIHH